MRTITAQTQTIWESGRYTGTATPMVRATIQRLKLMLCSYGNQTYSSIPFGQPSVPVELPNIRDVKWNRSVEGTIGTLTMTLYNTDALPLAVTPEQAVEMDLPGFYTPARGTTTFSSRWNHAANDWRDWIVPDRIIRTYEGYGFNPAVGPEFDTHLYPSGIWLIDDVTTGTDGLMTVECRDIGRALIDQVLAPPVVPTAYYPLYFETKRTVNNPDIVTTVGGWSRPLYDTSSNNVWVGNNPIFGHHAYDAFDASTSSYWLSVGNGAPEDKYSFEYVQGKFSSRTVSAVRVRTWAGPYQAYVSVYANGWQGTKTIPYDPNNPVSFPNGSNIRFVASFTAGRETTTTFKLPTPIAGATKVRITLTRLSRSAMGPYYYRGGLRNVEISSAITTTTDGGTHLEPTTTPPGITDFAQIITVLLAYAGWFWPNETSRAFRTRSDTTRETQAASGVDSALKSGRVWGLIRPTFTSPIAPLGVNVWDKKPVLDGIKTVVDQLGAVFFIDELGRAVFRQPNIWSIGNWEDGVRTDDVVEISDEQVLMSLSSKLSSRSIREKVFVGNLAGQVGAISLGRNPYPSGLRRVGGYTDGHFATAKECQIMADLITLRQLFTYRTDTVQIPGNPAVQIDDQVRIYERISEEGHLHYVKGIEMSWSVETGVYTYNLQTHWLGETPFSAWTFDPESLAQETRDYIEALGLIT